MTFLASNFVCMRKLREVHFSVLIFAFSVMSAIVSATIVPLVAEYRLPRTPEGWVRLIFMNALKGCFVLIAFMPLVIFRCMQFLSGFSVS